MTTPANDSQFHIVDYEPDLRKYFESLNREWLEAHFAVEPVDLLYFQDPEKTILDKGGEIFFALMDETVIGTCSLVYDDDHLELAKMAVTESARGKGAGEMLLKEGIRRAQLKGESRLILVTNSKLLPAIALYKKYGFLETFRGTHPKYSRGDVVMELALK